MVKQTKRTGKAKVQATPTAAPTQPTGEFAPLTPAQKEALHNAIDAKLDQEVLSVAEIEARSAMLQTDEDYQGAVFTLADFDALVARKLLSLRKGVYRITRAGEKWAADSKSETPPAAKKKDLDSYIRSLQLAATVEKLQPRDKLAFHTALFWADDLDMYAIFDMAQPAPVLSLEERLLLTAYRGRDYHVFSRIADDLLADEKHATELARVKNYKPLESREVSERDSDTFYTPLEMMALDVTAYLAKGWIPRGVMFYDDNYMQMLFGIAETMLESLIEDHAYGEMGELGLWLRYREEIEAAQELETSGETDD